MPVFYLEGEFSVESPPEAGEQEAKQDAADGEGRMNAAVQLHEFTSRWVKNTLAAKFR